MTLIYNTDIGYGIRIVKAAEGRPAGHVVEIHFYDKKEAVKYVARLIHAASQEEEAG